MFSIRRPSITTNFQSFCNYLQMNQDTFLLFAQSVCQPQPISARTLDVFSDCICCGTYFKKTSPKCSENPITVTPIWKWDFENKEHPIRGLCMTFFEKFLFKFLFSHKRFKMGQKCIFINCTSCKGSPQQIPFQFANGKLPHSHCRAFWDKRLKSHT